jgi:hypothetical protein
MTSRREGRVALIAAILCISTGCYSVRYNTDLPRGGRVHTQGASYFLGGLIGNNTVNLDNVCPNGVARWENKHSFLDLLLGSITAGIYTPLTIEIECAGGSAYRLEEKPSENVTAVTALNMEVLEVAP